MRDMPLCSHSGISVCKTPMLALYLVQPLSLPPIKRKAEAMAAADEPASKRAATGAPQPAPVTPAAPETLPTPAAG